MFYMIIVHDSRKHCYHLVLKMSKEKGLLLQFSSCQFQTVNYIIFFSLSSFIKLSNNNLFLSKLFRIINLKCLSKWFSTGEPRHPCMHRKN